MGSTLSRIDTSLFLLGLVFVSIVGGEVLYILFVANPLGILWVSGFVTSLPFILVPFYIGYWLPDSSVSVDRYTRVYYWSLAGLCVFLLMNVVIMTALRPTSTLQLVSWVRWASTIGAGGGLIIGAFEARGLERAVKTERARVRAEEAETRTSQLTYLNSILRHEVLNTATVIQGNAKLAAVDCDSDTIVSERLDTITTHARELEAVIDDIRILLDASGEDLDSARVDVVGLLASEVATVREAEGTVEIETSMPDEAIVPANQALRRAFRNILRNAVEHNTSETPRIVVTVERGDETVVVRVADNGPGVPAAKREKLFEQEVGDDHGHGLGLLLTGTLIESFDGTIELAETGPDGTVFRIELPGEARSTREAVTSPS
jgi:two-component system OmpR family sensor kinase